MAISTNKNEWVNAFANKINANNSTIGGSGSGSVDNNNERPATPDKYDSLQYTSYKDMLSSKIQANVAQEQANKYVANSLASAGYGSQGMAESTRLGIANTYQKAIASADETHQQNLIDIENQRQTDAEATSNEDWQSAMTMLQQATSLQDLDYVKSNFYDSMTDKQKKMFDYYYASYSKSLNNEVDPDWLKSNTVNEVGYSSYADMVAGDLKTENIKYGIDDVKNEATLLFDSYTQGRENGDVVRLQHHGGGSTNGIYLIYYQGKWYKTDEAHYNSATNKAFFEDSQFKSGTGTFTKR